MGRVMKMDPKKEWPQRKRLRLENYDYSKPGAYFITICTHNRRQILSRVAPYKATRSSIAICIYN